MDVDKFQTRLQTYTAVESAVLSKFTSHMFVLNTIKPYAIFSKYIKTIRTNLQIVVFHFNSLRMSRDSQDFMPFL